MYQSLIRRRRDQGFKIYKLKGKEIKDLKSVNLREISHGCVFFKRYVIYIFFYYYFIIRDEFEFHDLEYCVLISVLNLNNFSIHKNHKDVRKETT